MNITLEELLEAPWKKVLLPNWIAQAGRNIESRERPHGNDPHRMRQQMSQPTK